MKPKQKRHTMIQLSQEYFAPRAERFSLEEAHRQGRVADVTAWSQREMGFHPEAKRVRVLLTARLLRGLYRVPPLAQPWQTVRSRGYGLLWTASYALRKARRRGSHAATFDAFLPLSDDAEAIQTLRVEYRTCESGRPLVLIGFAEELVEF